MNCYTSTSTVTSDEVWYTVTSNQVAVNAINTGGATITYNDTRATVKGDVVVDGRSIKELLETIAERMLILTPDPEKLEKYEALKRAYDHYKLMERLCNEDQKD